MAGIILSLQLKPVQTWAAKKAATFLSSELKTQVQIKSLYLEPFKSLVLEGFFIADLDKDTLLNAPKLTVDIAYFAPFKERKITLQSIELENATFYLKEYKDTTTNLSFIINYFNSGVVDTTVKKKPFDFTLNNATIKNLDFRYKNYRTRDTLINGVNYDDVHITHLSTNLENINTKDYILKAKINKLTFKERSGFVLNNLTANATIASDRIVLEQLYLKTPKSSLRDYFSMRFKSYADFDDVINKVTMEGHFKNARIDAKDIAFFAPQIDYITLPIDVTGVIKGKVNGLKAKDLLIKAGKTTYIKGDFEVKGLPETKNTFLDLNFKQIYSNKADVDYIIERLTGNKKNTLPDVINKFGNINFKGQFTGFFNDFVAYGDFKTKLGQIKSDVNMKINRNNVPSYSGKLQAIDFNLGDLIGEESINRTSFVANIDGRGFDLNQLTEKLDVKATYFEFNGYSYRNIKVNGNINKQVFDGKLNIDDKNINLDFDGKANLNPNLPEFNFIANVQQARLHKLNFGKDTLSVDAVINTNFKGSNLANIQGQFNVNDLRVTTTEKSVVIDSVQLKAEGVGTDRLLALTSNIGDAYIKGEYDLNTLPSAFKTIVKKYIPSYRTAIVKPKNQNFEFRVDLKNFDYLSSLLIPELKIPERGAFYGKFNSSKDTVTLSGFVKTLTYNDITFNNIIIDQNTNSKSLEAIVSMDKVQFSEGGAFVQNIIIQNTLRNDSLTFNVKLSDKDAINQLDLYGLVKFGTDTLAQISLLPSEVIIDNQVWKIQDQVKIKFENARTLIENFELSSNNQLIAINGAISKNPEDGLEVVIKDFKISSLSQVTKAYGVDLSGTLNGTANLSAILGTPNIKSDLTVDTLKYNNTLIGNLKTVSVYNNATNKLDVDASIFKGNTKTMDVKGNIDIKSETNNLNLDVALDKTELVIVEPFVKNLVSNLKGQISSDLKVTGKFNNPKIDGTVDFLNTGVTVNYLKTAYTFTHKVTVENSVININNLKLTDINGNIATANGTVDLRKPDNPTITAEINATNFMALNTTAKDNPLYYGKAFATGKFTFAGPTDAMKINIKAKTEKGTEFTIPLNGASTVSSDDFITYVAKDSSLNKKEAVNYFNGLTMEFDLAVDEGTTANILTEVGNLTGQGTAQLNLKITSLGDFEMKGDYIIDAGQFDFTANNLIDKTFDIKKGGTLRWTGDPSDAEININASYTTRASLAPLYAAAGRTLPDKDQNLRVLAEADMLLKGSLLNPQVDFNLSFPNNSGYMTELQGYLDDKDNEAQQVINLVVRNSFNGNSSAGIGIDNQTLIGSGLELGFSKLQNIVSQTLGVKNLDFNLRSLSEFGIGYSFFNNRLKVQGNFVNNKYDNDYFNNNVFNSSFNDLTRDAQMTYDIKKDGSLVGKIFNRPSSRDFFNLNNDIYTNGVGLVYVQEYDTFKEFIQNTFGRAKKKTEEQEKEESESRSKTRQSPIVYPPKKED
ncbi:translocation/assembly module TamB domain-containing protein [Pedobacter arcticus]|uniref:translocation/assembly module TamB domain-containing protein n=1 Tax=Pedobacter arcticus TaxID=752140 RepID=UPI001ED9C5FE|nr:translocation/assembly module TamB domain-containing protein [Pedobacter arcticus]